MPSATAISALISHYGGYVGIGTGLVFVIMVLYTYIRMARLHRVYNRLTRNSSGGSLEAVLLEYSQQVAAVDGRITALEREAVRLGQAQLGCFQRVGLVRYDAFEDVGGKQSFSLVVLDDRRNGLALSSVFSRNDVRVYAKQVRGGAPSHPLTAEEQEAMSMAESRRADA